MELIENSFMHHKSLEVLDLSDNELPKYDNIVNLLEKNKHLRTINIKGSEMSLDSLGFIWLGLRENISVMNLYYQRANIVLTGFQTIRVLEA